MGANDKLAATFHPTTTAHMVDAISYPVVGDEVSITERARPIINRLLADAWDAGMRAGFSAAEFCSIPINPYRITPPTPESENTR